MSFQIGDRVIINPDNDNENYKEFRGKTLIVISADVGGRGYDETMLPEQLMDFETEEGEEVPFSLYEYEVVK